MVPEFVVFGETFFDYVVWVFFLNGGFAGAAVTGVYANGLSNQLYPVNQLNSSACLAPLGTHLLDRRPKRLHNLLLQPIERNRRRLKTPIQGTNIKHLRKRNQILNLFPPCIMRSLRLRLSDLCQSCVGPG